MKRSNNIPSTSFDFTARMMSSIVGYSKHRNKKDDIFFKSYKEKDQEPQSGIYDRNENA